MQKDAKSNFTEAEKDSQDQWMWWFHRACMVSVSYVGSCIGDCACQSSGFAVQTPQNILY